MALVVPRIFHWIWLGGDPLPDRHRRWQAGWRRAHPDWRHVLWTDDNLPPLRNVAEFHSARTFAQKADIVRYEIVEHYGGVYLDTDMECLANIEPLLDGVHAFAGWLEPPAEIGIGIFGATPGHPWLVELVSQLPWAMQTGFDILWQTGPRFFTKVTKNRQDVVVFAREVLYADPVDVARDRVHGTPGAYAVHHASGSWVQHHASATMAKLRRIAEEELDPLIPCGRVFIRVDDDIGIKAFSRRRSVQFFAPGGSYVGAPSDDAGAIAELQRLQREGAEFIAFIGPASWWLDYYAGLREYLAASAVCLVKNERLIFFDLRKCCPGSPTPSAVESQRGHSP